MSKFRIVKSPWVGMSGTTYDEYIVQKKWLFWWFDCTSGFDTMDKALAYISKHSTKPVVVWEN